MSLDWLGMMLCACVCGVSSSFDALKIGFAITIDRVGVDTVALKQGCEDDGIRCSEDERVA